MSDNFGKFKSNAYYEGLLTERGREILVAYDMGIENAIKSLNYCLEEQALDDYVEPENEVEEENIKTTLFTLGNEVVRNALANMLLENLLAERDVVLIALMEQDEEEGLYYDDAKLQAMEEDFKKLNRREIIEKYPIFEFDENGVKHARHQEESRPY